METKGAAKIGTGTKLHPAIKDGGQIFFLCRCGNTQNGTAAKRAQFFAGLAHTCGKTQAADEWIPEDPDAWKLADDALMAARKAARKAA